MNKKGKSKVSPTASNKKGGKGSKTKNKQQELIRLNKFIAHSGIASRREADELIKAGLITVNGKVVKELGTKIKPTDVVMYKGKRLKGEPNVYIVMNKPKDTITTRFDPQGRKTVLDILGDEVKERVYPVGRLDRNTTGVLILTNDGELAQRLIHPSTRVPKVYIATLNKDISKSDMEKLVEGFQLEDGFTYVDMVFYFNQKRKDKIVIEIHSGRNRIIRRMLEHLGYEVKALDRIEFAGITKKDLKRGQWRYLTDKEVGFLYMISGQKIRNK